MAKKKKSKRKSARRKSPPWMKGLRAAHRARAAAKRAHRKHPVRGHTRRIEGRTRTGKVRVKHVRVRAHRSYEAAEKAPKRSCVPPRRKYRRRKPHSHQMTLAKCPPKRRSAKRPSTKRPSTKRRGASKKSYHRKNPKRVAAGRKAAATRKSRRTVVITPESHRLAAEGGRRRKARKAKSNPTRRYRRRHHRGAMENPLTGIELVTGGIAGLFGFVAADLVDRFVATHPLQVTTNKDAAGHVLYADTPPTAGTYTGLFNGTAVVAPMYVSWQRWLFPGLVAIIPIWGARYVSSNTARATVQMFGVGAGVRWLGKALTDGVATLLSYTCTGQRLYDPEIRGHALRKVNGNASDPTVTGYPSTGLGRRPAPGAFAPGTPPRQLPAGVGRCGKCGKAGVGACCGGVISCCPPAPPTQVQNPAPPAPPIQALPTDPVAPAPAPQLPQVQGPPRNPNPYKWGHVDHDDRDAA